MSVLYTEVYNKVIVQELMGSYIAEHGYNIHHHGTHSLVELHDVNEESALFLTLDVQDDYKTPQFFVTKACDDDLTVHKTFESALNDFMSRLN
jgi:hypothetical protein